MPDPALSMQSNRPSRRKFIKISTLGLTGSAVSNAAAHGKRITTNKKLSVICVGAHPGDPEFGCGGTLLKASEAGHQVTVLYLTRGEASDPSKSFSEMADLRTKEAETSCRILNVTPSFAGQTDGDTEYSKKTSDEFAKQILAAKPDVVLTHWPLDTHKDHQIAGLLTLNAWTRSGQAFELYFYEVNTGDETMGFSPTDYEDISVYRARKKQALMAHQTQNPGEVYDGFFKVMEDFRGLEAGVSAAEAFMHFKPKALRSKTFF